MNAPHVNLRGMDSVDAIFDELKGPSRVAKLLGVNPSTASEMKRRQSIPVKYWPRLVDACRGMGVMGVNYDVLVFLHAREHTHPPPDPA